MFVPFSSFEFHAMKTYFTSLLGVAAMSCLVATAASCSDRQKDPDPTIKSVEVHPGPSTNPVPERALPPTTGAAVSAVVASAVSSPTSDPFAEAASTLDRATRDQAASLTLVPDTVSRGIDSNIAAWKARGGTSTTMSESKLELARTDFTQKIQALSLADQETWKNAKTTAQSSLENLRRAYSDLMTGQEHAS
jgi:hypothetical protein